MYHYVLVACLIGVCFTSSLNESKKEQKDIEKDITDQYAITDMEPNMETIIGSKHNIGSGERVEDARIKPRTSPMESFLNLFSVDMDDNGPFSPDSKENQTNISENTNEEYGDSVIEEVDSKTQQEHKTESQQYESNDQQGQELSSDGLLDQYVRFRVKANTDHVKPMTDGITVNGHILEEIYDDEDLQYILNMTHNLDSMKQGVSNESHEELYVEASPPENVKNIKDLESAANIKEDHVNDDAAETSTDDVRIKRENLISEEKGVKTRTIFGDLVIRQKESAAEEQQTQESESSVDITRLRGDAPDVDYSSEPTTTDKNDGNAAFSRYLEIGGAAFPTYHGKSGELHGSHHDQVINAAVQRKEGSIEIQSMNVSADACTNFHCKRGKMCETNELGNPFCACQDPDYCLPGNRNDLVCGTDNKTYTSTCHLFGKKCLLEGTKEGNHLHLDYQGPCKYIPPCTEYELALFPFRMRDWLKNVLMQLYERDQEHTGLSEKQKSKVKKIYEDEKRLQEGDHNIELLVKDFQKNYHMYVYPVHWQFHQLDQHSKDKLLTRSELAALRAPLIPIEHCVNAFLQECNTNNDRQISLLEWCHCFGIKEGDVNEDLLF